MSGPTGFRKVAGHDAEVTRIFVSCLALLTGYRQAEDLPVVPMDDGVKDTVDVLARSTDLKLIFNYARWVLEQNLVAGTAIFVSSKRAEPLPVEEVLGFLFTIKKGGAQGLCIAFLHFHCPFLTDRSVAQWPRSIWSM